MERSLSALQTDYLDLYLIHWPGASGVDVGNARNAELRRQSWEVLAQYQRKGVIRAVGVSNYQRRHLQGLIEQSEVMPQVSSNFIVT